MSRQCRNCSYVDPEAQFCARCQKQIDLKKSYYYDQTHYTYLCNRCGRPSYGYRLIEYFENGKKNQERSYMLKLDVILMDDERWNSGS